MPNRHQAPYVQSVGVPIMAVAYSDVLLASSLGFLGARGFLGLASLVSLTSAFGAASSGVAFALSLAGLG